MMRLTVSAITEGSKANLSVRLGKSDHSSTYTLGELRRDLRMQVSIIQNRRPNLYLVPATP